MIRIGSRGSDLALWQARYVAARLGGETDIVVIKTAGDQIQHLSLDKVEGKGFFTKEIEAALLAGDVDVAVHSYKDLPIESPEGLRIAAVPQRAPVRDVLVAHNSKLDGKERWGLVHGAKVGTSSLRRKAQLLAQRPDLTLVDLRGNVPTRIQKAESGELDAVVLAEAGLTRLQIMHQRASLTFLPLSVTELCPAPAQGALAIQTRLRDAATQQRVELLHDTATAQAVGLERDLLARFGGGCHLPLGAFASCATGMFELLALIAAPDGHELLHARAQGSNAQDVVENVYRSLESQGAARYL